MLENVKNFIRAYLIGFNVILYFLFMLKSQFIIVDKLIEEWYHKYIIGEIGEVKRCFA